jgi:hypothetical protein
MKDISPREYRTAIAAALHGWRLSGKAVAYLRGLSHLGTIKIDPLLIRWVMVPTQASATSKLSAFSSCHQCLKCGSTTDNSMPYNGRQLRDQQRAGGAPTEHSIPYTRIATNHIVLDLLLPSHNKLTKSCTIPTTNARRAAAAKTLFEQSQITVSEVGMQQSETQGTRQQQLSNREWRVTKRIHAEFLM